MSLDSLDIGDARLPGYLNRVDLFIRTGLARVMLEHGWMPIIAEHTMNYRKPLGVFKRFKATMHLTHWDEKYFFMTQLTTRSLPKALLRELFEVKKAQSLPRTS